MEDHARAIDLIFHEGKVADTYNIGGFNEWKNIDLIKVIIKTTDRLLGNPEGYSDGLITFVTDRAGHDLRYAIDAVLRGYVRQPLEMSSYLEVVNVSKSYGPRVLFDHISFHIDEGDKIALVAPNGTGKTSLLSIIAGKDSSDGEGEVRFLKDITVAFLEQDQHYAPDRTIADIVLEGAGDKAHDVQDYEVAAILSQLHLNDPSRKAGTLSGGESKRTAIVAALIRKPDFLVLDEPTNHLDVDSIEFLEDYLTRSRCTLLMVTHDRYFLDRVCNQILELDGGQMYRYNGNYEYFLQKRPTCCVRSWTGCAVCPVPVGPRQSTARMRFMT